MVNFQVKLLTGIEQLDFQTIVLKLLEMCAVARNLVWFG